MSEIINEIFGGQGSGSGGAILQWDPVLEPNKVVSGKRGGGTYVIVNNSTITNIDNVPAGTGKNTIIYFNEDIEKWEICSASDSQQVYKGTFATPAILQSTYPAASQNIGSTADVLSTGTKWFVNTSNVWVDSGGSGDLSSLKIANFLSEFNTPTAKSTAAQNIDVYQKAATDTLLDTKITKISNPVANQIPLMDANGSLFKSNKSLGDFEPVITTKNSAFNKNYGTDVGKLKQNGVAAVGTEDSIARLDHVHPSDTAKADLTYVNTQLALKPNTTDVNTALNLKLDKTSVVNTLTSTSTTDTLAAAQGKVLQDTKLDKTSVKDTLTSTSTTDALATSAGKQLKDLVDTKANSSDITTLAQQAVINNGVASTTQTYSSSTIEDRLANLPQGGGSGISYYLGNTASDISTYNVLETSPFATTGTFTATANNNQVLLKSFATAALNRTIVNSGFWEFNFSCSINTSPTSGKVSNLFIELYTRDGLTETLISSVTTESITSLSKIEVNAVLTQQQLNITSTTRLVVKVYAKTTEVGNVLFTLFYGGTDSHIHTPFKLTKADIGLSNVENVDTTKASNVIIDGTFTPINSPIVANDTVKVGLQKSQGQIDNLSSTKQNNISVTDTTTIDLTFSNSNLEGSVKDGSIDATKLANNAVTTNKILDNNVTDQKIATGVNSAKIQQTTFTDNTNTLVNGDTLDVALNKIQYQAKDAIHKNTTNEINNLTNKATLIDTDIVLGENSANLFSKIKFTMSSVASYILSKDKNVKNWYVHNTNGNDSNNGYSPNNAFLTLDKATTLLGNTGEALIWLVGQFSTNVTFNQLNVDIKGDNSNKGAATGTSGAVTSSNASSSQRYSNLVFGAFTKTGAGQAYLENVNITGTLNDTSAGYLKYKNGNIGNLSITGTGIKVFEDFELNGTIAINNALVSVSFNGVGRAMTLSSTSAISLTAGTLAIRNMIIYCPANTVFGASGVNFLFDNVQFINPATGLAQVITIPAGVNYSLQNCEYDPTSTINGTDISSTRIKRFANVFAKIADITSATIQTLNVKDKTILLNSSNSTDASADAGGLIVKGATNKSILFTNTAGANPSNFSSSENINVVSGKNYYINNVLYAEATKTLKNTTINISDSNTISEISDANIAANAGINANKIGSGNVDNTKFSYLANVTSDIQTQLNDKQTSSATLTTLASTANPETLVKFGAVALTPADNGKFPQVNASGNIEYVTLSPSSGGNVNATNISGATGKALISLNDTLTSVGLITTAAQKQSFAKSSSSIAILTTTEVSSLSWTTDDIIYNKTESKFLKYTASATWVDANASIGEYRKFANTTESFGWLKCIGQDISRTTYTKLFIAIGTSFGIGDGSTTFTLPDFRSSVFGDVGLKINNYTFAPANVDIATDIITIAGINNVYTGTPIVFTSTGTVPTGLTAGTTYYAIKVSATTIRVASSLANANAGSDINLTTTGTGVITATVTLTNRTLGINVGQEDHLLTENEMPSHNHSYTRYSTLLDVNINGNATNMLRSTSIQDTGSAGGTMVHNIMQPTLFGGSTFIFTGV
jgi:microcystin-dependent protein